LGVDGRRRRRAGKDRPAANRHRRGRGGRIVRRQRLCVARGGLAAQPRRRCTFTSCDGRPPADAHVHRGIAPTGWTRRRKGWGGRVMSQPALGARAGRRRCTCVRRRHQRPLMEDGPRQLLQARPLLSGGTGSRRRLLARARCDRCRRYDGGSRSCDQRPRHIKGPTLEETGHRQPCLVTGADEALRNPCRVAGARGRSNHGTPPSRATTAPCESQRCEPGRSCRPQPAPGADAQPRNLPGAASGEPHARLNP
jgi:hypothetical protein